MTAPGHGERTADPRRPWPAGVSLRVLDQQDSAALAELRQRVVLQQLGNAEFYRLEAEGPDFPDSHLDRVRDPLRGLIAGLFEASGQLIGYGALSLPGPDEPTRGDCLDLPDGSQQIAYLASAMLLEQWRGYGLHHRLIEWRLARARELGRRHVVAASYPGNHISWGNLAGHGLLGKCLIRVSRGLLRLVSHCDLATTDAPRPDLANQILLPVADLERAAVWFDDGYWLWGRSVESAETCAILARPIMLKSC